MSPREFQEVAWESLGREEGRAVARDWGPQAHGGDPLTECRRGWPVSRHAKGEPCVHLPPSCWFGFARARLLGERHNLVPSLTSALDSSQEFQASLQATHSRCWKQSSTSALCQHQAQASVRSRRGGMRARLRDQVQQQPRAAAGKPTSALPGSPDAAPHFILLEACASWLLLCSSPCFPLTSLMAPSQSPLKVAFCFQTSKC